MENIVTRVVDWFYFPFISRWLPRMTFRYAVCGGGNVVLNWVLYAVLYNFILDKKNLDLGVVVISPHIAAFLIVFPITFFTGYWLMKNIAFGNSSPLRTRTQLFRYMLVVCGTIAINYAGLKVFVEVLHIYPTPSQMLVNVFTITFSYFCQKYFTFRGSSDQ